MSNHTDHAGVLEAACWALEIFAGADNEIRQTTPMEGVINAIIKGLCKHPDHKVVQAQGCRALRTLAFNRDTIKQEIINKGGEKYL